MKARVRVLAPAKINLGLEVLGRRDDGYHEVVTILQAIRLTDTIELRRTSESGIRLLVEPRRLDLGPVEQNLAVRAARLFPQKTRAGGLEIRLRKRIPAGAGLGGGSSDAAAVLVGLNALWSAGLAVADLEQLGAALGSDVPFFIRGGTQLGTGRGEVLRPLPAWPGRRMVVVFPNLSISTSSIYKGSTFRLTHPGALSNLVSHGIPSRFWAILGSGDGAALRNDLTPATLRSAPVVGRILKEMRELGSDFASVSGSGSAVFGLAPDGRTAALWEEHFRRRGFWSKEVRPSRRGCSIRN